MVYFTLFSATFRKKRIFRKNFLLPYDIRLLSAQPPYLAHSLILFKFSNISFSYAFPPSFQIYLQGFYFYPLWFLFSKASLLNCILGYITRNIPILVSITYVIPCSLIVCKSIVPTACDKPNPMYYRLCLSIPASHCCYYLCRSQPLYLGL